MVALLIMVPLSGIYVEVAAPRLAETAGIALPEADSFLELVRPLIRPAAVFAEVLTKDILGLKANSNDWGVSLVVGLATLGPDAPRAFAAAPDNQAMVRTFLSLALNDALDFIDYRILRYLEPKGLRPGVRMIPGCPDLPLSVNRTIMDYFGTEHSLGLFLDPSGRIEDPSGTAFIYPQSEKIVKPQGCVGCSHKTCPVWTTTLGSKTDGVKS